VLFCSHSLYHVRQLCDRVLWLDHGRVQALGDTETVLMQYETHVRLQDNPAVSSKPPAPAADSMEAELAPKTSLMHGKRAALASASVVGLGERSGATLQGSDLIVQVEAVTSNDETPSIGIMLQLYQGSGVTSVATHADGVKPTAGLRTPDSTNWEVTLTFPDLPLHSGYYSLSFYLFDGQGLVVYDEWMNYIQFHWVSPSLTPGLVHLPHQWT
jgi:lipopolysaccharide transport system ATP-binding protein